MVALPPCSLVSVVACEWAVLARCLMCLAVPSCILPLSIVLGGGLGVRWSFLPLGGRQGIECKVLLQIFCVYGNIKVKSDAAKVSQQENMGKTIWKLLPPYKYLPSSSQGRAAHGTIGTFLPLQSFPPPPNL